MNDAKTAPFDVCISISDLGPDGVRIALDADEPARAAAASRLGALRVLRLSGQMTIRPEREGARVDGIVNAVLERQCVVTLDPLEEKIVEPFSIHYTRETIADQIVELAGDDDWAETLLGDLIEPGDLLVQQAALAMAPYPRKSGAEAPTEMTAGAAVSPFDTLKNWKPGGL